MINAENTRVDALPAYKQTDYDPIIDSIIDFTAEPLFLEAGYAKELDLSNPDSEEYKQHLQDYAVDYCQTLSGVESEESLTTIALFASAPLAMHKKKELDANKVKHHLKNTEFQNAKNGLVQFNFLLAKYIEQHPAENADMLANGLTEISNRFNEKPDVSAYDGFDQIVQGIRTEFGFKQVVDQIKTISLRHSNAQEERKGIDFVLGVPLPGQAAKVNLSIDIKSSLDQVAGVAGGYNDSTDTYAKDRNGHFKFYPLLPKSSYENGSFLVKKSFAEQLIPQIGMQLFLMAKSI